MINETDTKKGNSMDLNRQLIEAMADLNEDLVIATVRQMAAEGHSFEEIQQCLNTGISAVGTRFERGDYFIADLIVSGMIYRSALNEREPLRSGGAPPKSRVRQCLNGLDHGLLRGGQHAAAEGLCEHEHIARLRAGIFEDAVGMDKARDAQAILWIVWPPAMTQFASTALACPPSRMARISSFGRQFGTQRRFIATLGTPPMAYTSLSAFAAAICPKR